MDGKTHRRVALFIAVMTLLAVAAPARPTKGTRIVIKAQPMLECPPGATARFSGFVGERLEAAIDGWLLPAPRANPSLLYMFRDRDRQPRRALVPWAGEFAGKHLTASVLVYRATGDKRLFAATEAFVHDFIAGQDADGYLGPFPRGERLVGKTASGERLWDVWGHYHALVGLLLWHDETGDEAALGAARRIGDLMCRTFLDANVPVTVAGAEEMNLSIAHGLCLLYRETGEERTLRLARRIVDQDWTIPPAGDYVRQALAGKEFWELPKPRWESLHCLLALPELYAITGEAKYRDAFERLWWSIARGDRHNTGGFTSGEQAVGNPYATGAIETCCTVAWSALSVEMLRLTGDPRVADEIELATFNGSLGGQTPSGRWWTYNTPSDGVKRASAHEIVFQSHPGGPELNCCSVNAPRIPGMLSEWALLRDGENGAALCYYGPSVLETDLRSGNRLRLRQKTTYPASGVVNVTLALDRPETFALRLRIPQWSERTTITVNGEPVKEAITPRAFFPIRRAWKTGDVIRLFLDLSFHYWAGEREEAGKASIYRGPILLAFDPRFNTLDPDAVPTLDLADGLTGTSVRSTEWPAPWLLLHVTDKKGASVTLCDFASAGAMGTPYRSWLPAAGLAPRPFSREQPVWANRPSGAK